MSAPRARLAALGAAIVAAVGLSGRPAMAVPACGNAVHQDQCGGGNIYPCCDNGGNCTWWAWESVCRNWHVALVNWGNANTWAGHAQVDPDYDVVGSPVVGSVATSTLGTYGHVAWVTAVNGGNITVTEENCCVGCAPGVGTRGYSASYFNSGFVVRHGSLCACAPGQTQTQACGDCGTRSRSCDGCDWGGWGSCEGPDPGGGNVSCDTGALGPCAEGRVRCIGGNTACRPLVEPSPETCDAVDDDCNGAVDDGHPKELGTPPPDYAATLVDASYPQALQSGEHAWVWADFRNDGAKPWGDGEVWLRVHGGEDGGASALYAMGAWPAWNVAAVLDGPTEPGETARFVFEIVAPKTPGASIAETFELEVPGQGPIACPSAEVSPVIHILPSGDGAGGAGGAGATPPAAETFSDGGCSETPGSGGFGLGAALALALLAASRARRAAARASG
jgi:surface antigen